MRLNDFKLEETQGSGVESGFYLGFFVEGGGESILKEDFEPRGGEKKFLGLLGGPGQCSSGKV